VLLRVEQFRADALVMPQINQDTSVSRLQETKQGEEAVVYGAGAKSAGSIDSTPAAVKGKKGQTSLTGKNPFAILKASAIASVQPAAFPNNFTNLPKAFPPFLGQI
jgi:hypothetical protein